MNSKALCKRRSIALVSIQMNRLPANSGTRCAQRLRLEIELTGLDECSVTGGQATPLSEYLNSFTACR